MAPLPLASALPPVLAAEAAGRPPFLENLSYQFAGMAVVLLALGMICTAVALLGRMLQAAGRRPAPAPTAAPAALDERVVAAIAAAVAHVVRQPHRVVAVRPDTDVQHAWSAEGRRAIYQSHKVR